MNYSAAALYLCVWAVQASVCLGIGLLQDVPQQVRMLSGNHVQFLIQYDKRSLHFFLFSIAVRLLVLPTFGLRQAAQARNPVRFWIDEFPFSEGETKILRESIEVSIDLIPFIHCPSTVP